MTKKINIVAASAITLLFIAVAAFLVMGLAGGMMPVKASGIRLATCDNVAGQGGAGAKATTTPIFLTSGGATSTMPACNVSQANYFSIMVRQNASSSSSGLDYIVQASMNGQEWYNFDRDESLSAGVVAHQATTTELFQPSIVGLSSLAYTYPNFGFAYVRILYSALAANSSQYIQIIPTNDIPN